MKKVYLTLSMLVVGALGLSAQNTFPASGNVAISTSTSPAKLSVAPLLSSGTNIASVFLAGEHGVLGDAAGSYLYPFEFQHANTGNFDRLQFAPYRRVAGNNWNGTAYRVQFAVDNSFTEGNKAFVELSASDPNTDYLQGLCFMKNK